MRDLSPHYSGGWIEGTDDSRHGRFDVHWGRPANWDDIILQGRFLFVSTPFYKFPNETMKHNQDTSSYDLERLGADELPIVSFTPAVPRPIYSASYTQWGEQSALRFFRVAWRKMADNVGQRTLMPAIIPPGAAHVDGIYSLGLPTRPARELVAVQGYVSSLVADFCVRVAPKANIRSATVDQLPVRIDGPLLPELLLRTLRLNCLTFTYADLWECCFEESFRSDCWAAPKTTMGLPLLAEVGRNWSSQIPLRRAVERRQAQLEIDVIVALELDVKIEELISLYRTQFPVLAKFDRTKYIYDVAGRLVPTSVLATWRRKGSRITAEERSATNQAGNAYTYELPFVTLDREADMREAYAVFEQRLRERS